MLTNLLIIGTGYLKAVGNKTLLW